MMMMMIMSGSGGGRMAVAAVSSFSRRGSGRNFVTRGKNSMKMSLLSKKTTMAAAAAAVDDYSPFVGSNFRRHQSQQHHQQQRQSCFLVAPSKHKARFSTFVRGGSDGNGNVDNDNDNDNVSNDETHSPYRVYLAVGSNLGNRFDNIRQALQLLCQSSTTTTTTRLVKTSFLHETAPMYVTDQPAFLNGAVELATTLRPHELLDELKRIERKLGRHMDDGADNYNNDNNSTNTTPVIIRNGPRPVDLDILFYETRVEQGGSWFRRETLQSHNLTIPHPRIQERMFVLQPLLEVAGPSFVHPVLNTTIGELYERLREENFQERLQNGTDDNAAATDDDAVRVLPLPRNRFLYWNETLVMGVLNVTPDSFSDGGQYNNNNNDNSGVERAAQRAMQMVIQEGACIIDIGGESTRPGAQDVALQEELNRTIPVIQRIRQLDENIPLSIDTRRSAVAKAAVEAGADLVNDVSGGSFDPEMLPTVASLGVPMVLMHMRGTPQTMQSMTDYGGGNSIVNVVASSLAETSEAATAAGIHRWLQIVDPGIGFAKDMNGSLLLLRNLSTIRAATGNLPILLGTSRKGFLGKLTGVDVAADRDFATVASCIAPLCLEQSNSFSSPSSTATMLRVHNPAAMAQAVKVMHAIRETPQVR